MPVSKMTLERPEEYEEMSTATWPSGQDEIPKGN